MYIQFRMNFFFITGSFKMPFSMNYREYKCSECSRTFSQKIHLLRHLERHEDVRTVYPCSICSRTFTRKDNLQQHEKLYHNIVRKKGYSSENKT